MKNRGAVVLLSTAAVLCVFIFGIFIGRNFTGGVLLLSRPADTTIPLVTQSKTLININTADAETLQSISGIGPVLAERIIAYRTENGPFTELGQLANVQGVGARLMETIYECATLGG